MSSILKCAYYDGNLTPCRRTGNAIAKKDVNDNTPLCKELDVSKTDGVAVVTTVINCV